MTSWTKVKKAGLQAAFPAKKATIVPDARSGQFDRETGLWLRRNGIRDRTNYLRIMDLYGIIGYPLGHSFSQRYFTEKFAREGIAAARYEQFPLPAIGAFPELIAAQPALRGLNVTIPYKVAVLDYLHALDETARAVGAVNTIRVRKGQLTGYNTDAIGFERSLRSWLAESGRPAPAKALILGTGGASKAVAWVLKNMGLACVFVSRNPLDDRQVGYPDLPALLAEHTLIVNTTPLGMYPNMENCPELPFPLIGERHLVYDLVYNPAETLLLQRAKSRGAAIKNGLEMLQLQAEAAWDIWQRPQEPVEHHSP